MARSLSGRADIFGFNASDSALARRALSDHQQAPKGGLGQPGSHASRAARQTRTTHRTTDLRHRPQRPHRGNPILRIGLTTHNPAEAGEGGGLQGAEKWAAKRLRRRRRGPCPRASPEILFEVWQLRVSESSSQAGRASQLSQPGQRASRPESHAEREIAGWPESHQDNKRSDV